MKKRTWMGLGLVLAMFLTGCKGFWDLPPGSSGSGGTTPTQLSSGIFYVLNQDTKQIVGYSINTGKLTAISGATQTLSDGPSAIAIAPNGGFLYVSIPGGIFLFTVFSGGGLSSGQSINGDSPQAMQVDPSGSWLVEAFNTGSDGIQVNAIPITTTGTLDSGRTEQTPTAFTFPNASVAPNVDGMAISGDGKYVFVAGGTGGALAIPFTSGNASPLATGNATPINPAHSLSAVLSVAVDPGTTPRLFYVGETVADPSLTTGGLLVFNYSSLSPTGQQQPTQISGSPIASGGAAPNAVLPIADGQYVYVANGASGTTVHGNVAWFPIGASGTTYSIAAGSNIVSGIRPISLTEDSLGNFVLAVATGGSTNSGDPDLDAFTMSSGVLTSAIQSATGTDPVGAVAVAALP